MQRAKLVFRMYHALTLNGYSNFINAVKRQRNLGLGSGELKNHEKRGITPRRVIRFTSKLQGYPIWSYCPFFRQIFKMLIPFVLYSKTIRDRC
jgi:hypothetical protein